MRISKLYIYVCKNQDNNKRKNLGNLITNYNKKTWYHGKNNK